MKARLIVVFVLSVLLMTACQSQEPEATATPEPATATAVPPTAVPPTEAPVAPTAEPAAEITETEGEGDTGEIQEENESDQAAQMAAINPPPQLSDRELGIHVVPCPPNRVPGADEVEGETYSCGIFTVPQNWDEPDGRNLDLSFVVVKANGENPEPDPVMFLAGGPGQSAIIAPVATYDKLRPARDIIRMDQRGTGFSQRLGLEECLVLAIQNESPASELEVIQTGLNAFEPNELNIAPINQICWDLFTAQDLDLNLFNTASSTRDVIELIKALEYDSFNLHGVSYGTRLAMTIMNELSNDTSGPELRSVVLDSAFPPSIYMLSSLPRSDHDFVLQLLEECEADDLCQNAYPNLGERLGSLLENLAQEPITSNGETVTLDDVVKSLSNLGSTRAGYMPKMIAELEMGVLDTYLALLNWEIGTGDPEGVPGLDRNDPVQAFMGDAVKLAGGSDDMGVMFTFVSGMEEAAGQEDPIQAAEAFINENYTDNIQAQLLDRLSVLTIEDFANSSYFEQSLLGVVSEGETAEITPEEQAALDLASERVLAVIGLALPLYNTIHCQEDLQFENVDDVINGINDLEFPQFVDAAKVQAVADGCLNWPVNPAPVAVKDPVSSDVPVLILQGAYDKATPVYMGELAQNELANSTYVLIPQQGHEIWKNAGGCAGLIAADFIENPDTAPDLSCLEIRQPQWALPETNMQ